MLFLKRRFNRAFLRLFPIWALGHFEKETWKAYAPELERAKTKGHEAYRLEVEVARHEAQQYAGERNALLSKRLLRKAEVIHALPAEEFHFERRQDWDEDEHGNKFLNRSAFSKLEHLVREKRRKDWEFRAKVIVPIVGTIIAMIAVLQDCGNPNP